MAPWREMSAKAKIRTVRSLLADGLNITEMAAHLEVSRPCVEGVMRRGKLFATNGQGRPRVFNYTKIAEFYRDHTMQEAVDKFGCSAETVRAAARRFGVYRKQYSVRPEVAAAKPGLLKVARHFGITLVQCQEKLLAALNEETTVAINLLEDA